VKRVNFDKGAYIRALQRGESEESARAGAEWNEKEEFHFMQRFKSWRYRNKQKKLENIWLKQLEHDKQNKKQ